MCDVSQEPTVFRPKLDGADSSGGNIMMFPTPFEASSFGKSDDSNTSSYMEVQDEKSRTGDLFFNQKYINMLIPPEISRSLKNKLHMSLDIEELSLSDINFKFILNNISNIIGDLLEPHGFLYHIDIRLRDKGNINEWERADIVIELPDEYYSQKNIYWKEISQKVSEFYLSLHNNPLFSEYIIDKLRKFIYIRLHTAE